MEQLIDQFSAAAMSREATFRTQCMGILETIRAANAMQPPPAPLPGGGREARLAGDAIQAHEAAATAAEQALGRLDRLVDECRADLNDIDFRFQMAAEEYRGEVLRRHPERAALSQTWQIPSVLDLMRDRIPWLGRESRQIAEAIVEFGVDEALSWSDYPVAEDPSAVQAPGHDPGDPTVG